MPLPFRIPQVREELLRSELELIELIEITFRRDVIEQELRELREPPDPHFRFANNPDPIEWPSGSGKFYEPVGYRRDPIELNSGDQVKTVRISASDVSGRFIDLLMTREILGARIRILRIFRQLLEHEEAHFVLFDGFLTSPAITENTFAVEAVSVLDRHNSQVPRRMFHSQCNYRWGDADCGLNPYAPEHNHYGEVMPGILTATEFCDNTIPANPESHIDPAQYEEDNGVEFEAQEGFAYWKGGYVTFLSGKNAGIRRAVRRLHFFNRSKTIEVERMNTRILLYAPLPFVPEVGDFYRLRRSCTYGLSDCHKRFRNKENFGGFGTMPRSVQVDT